jgi:putative tryptophan/tyrosine transport system substrate-binding protein
MNRREIIGLIGGAAVWPVAARAQGGPIRMVGGLFSGKEDDPRAKLQVAAFEQAMEARGWVKGRNVQFDYRWPADDDALVQAYSADLVVIKPDVILSESIPITRALKQATTTIPIVIVRSGDPVSGGVITSLARPGGNITGFFANEHSLAGKWFDLILEFVPKATRLGIVTNQSNQGSLGYVAVVRDAAQKAKVELTIIQTSEDAQVESAIEGLARIPVDGLLVLPGTSIVVHRKALITAAARYHLPAVFPFPEFPESGGLMSYGVDEIDLARLAAGYVDRILRGEKPGDLPVQEPTKFALVINLKTAKALGLTVPQTLLVAADEVIE